ncbi:hypothetical protein VTL71DRAFT_15400 [Oculimacula yallundae]|uniref:Hydrophobin n=1 Tax=Oculimacula yallundae TaxID=86028 RepID=A0ABR4CHS9_9HELO
MRFFLLLIAATSVIAGGYRAPLRPSRPNKSSREVNAGHPIAERAKPIPAVLPDYKAEIFMCNLGPEMKGYCCENLSQDGIGLECNLAAPIVANFLEETITFTCPLVIEDVKQNHTTGACCSPSSIMITPTMALKKCQGSTLVSVDIESKTPNVVGSLADELGN